jgi:hypothetical protein
MGPDDEIELLPPADDAGLGRGAADVRAVFRRAYRGHLWLYGFGRNWQSVASPAAFSQRSHVPRAPAPLDPWQRDVPCVDAPTFKDVPRSVRGRGASPPGSRQGPPLPVTLRLIHPPPKMTQG